MKKTFSPASLVITAAIVSLVVWYSLYSRKQRVRINVPFMEAELALVAASSPRHPPGNDFVHGDGRLTTNEYRVVKTKSDDIRAKLIQVAHWSFLDGKPLPVPSGVGNKITRRLIPFSRIAGLDQIPRSSNLNPFSTTPLFLDQTQTLELEYASLPDIVRYDYGGSLSQRMMIYWGSCHRLELVVIGDSITGMGVQPRFFFQEKEKTEPAPVAINLADGATNFEVQHQLIKKYLEPLPRLRWIIWGLTPQMFNKNHDSSKITDAFEARTGYLYDQKHWERLWAVLQEDPSGGKVSPPKDPRQGTDAWGGVKTFGSRLDFALPDMRRAYIEEQCGAVSFHLNSKVLHSLKKILKSLSKSGVQILLFIPPFHPETAGARAIDLYGTSQADYRHLIKYLDRLAGRMEHVYFRDFYNSGRHPFPADAYWDITRLNFKGSQMLTRLLAGEIKQAEVEKIPPPHSS